MELKSEGRTAGTVIPGYRPDRENILTRLPPVVAECDLGAVLRPPHHAPGPHEPFKIARERDDLVSLLCQLLAHLGDACFERGDNCSGMVLLELRDMQRLASFGDGG